jgi:hypothetical protein
MILSYVWSHARTTTLSLFLLDKKTYLLHSHTVNHFCTSDFWWKCWMRTHAQNRHAHTCIGCTHKFNMYLCLRVLVSQSLKILALVTVHLNVRFSVYHIMTYHNSLYIFVVNCKTHPVYVLEICDKISYITNHMTVTSECLQSLFKTNDCF